MQLDLFTKAEPKTQAESDREISQQRNLIEAWFILKKMEKGRREKYDIADMFKEPGEIKLSHAIVEKRCTELVSAKRIKFTNGRYWR